MAASSGWEVPRPQVAGNCQRCGVSDADVEQNRVVVSPAGWAHFGDGGDTSCGVDATGDNWWWPL